ncbi:MAG: glycosyl transferase family 1, partial [Bryobacteraceae bacterium]|nr:glycosyl transferase family 1 [Bryobacteraceae bacterium]
SRLAQISQQPPLFDFPRTNLPESFHYTGPFRDTCMSTTEFPWDQLDGRPLVYASLGSLQGAKKELFRTLAGACEGTGVQMVLSHGNALTPDALSKLPGSPLVVGYAPQFELLKRASLTLTHAGLNTVLDSLSHGVPQVAIPLTYEQPAIAQRIQWSGCGEVVPFPRANVERIRAAILLVLSSPSYRDAAQRISKSIQASGGVSRAADVIQMAVCATPYGT